MRAENRENGVRRPHKAETRVSNFLVRKGGQRIKLQYYNYIYIYQIHMYVLYIICLL